MSTLVSAALVAATPTTAVDSIVTYLSGMSGHQWVVTGLAVLTLAMWTIARLASRRPETLNQRSAREVEEARR